jgi:DHA3 family tetracycline resistance protein-like MFS transporter
VLQHRLDAYRVYLILSAATALSLSIIWTLNLVYQVEEVGLSPLQIVLVGTVLELSYFLLEVPTGIVADVYSRRLSVIIGTVILGAGFIVMGAVPAFWVLLVSQIICGIGYTFISGATEAWIADEIGEENAGRAFLRGAQAETAGTIAGIPLAVVLGNVALALPIVLGGAAIVLLAVFLIIAMPEHGFTPAPREDRTTWQSMHATFAGGTRMIRRRPVLLTIIGIAACFGMFNEGFDRLSVPHLLENYRFPSFGGFSVNVWIGGIKLVIELLGIGALELVRRKLDLTSHGAVTRTLFAINGALVLAVVAFGLAGSFALALAAMTAASVLRHSIYPIKTAWVNQSLDPRVRATVISMTGQADAFGQIAGGPAIGGIGSVFGLRAAMVAAAAALTPGLLLYTRALGQGEPIVTEEPVAIGEPT